MMNLAQASLAPGILGSSPSALNSKANSGAAGLEQASAPAGQRLRAEVNPTVAAEAVSQTLMRTDSSLRVAVAQIPSYPGQITANVSRIIENIRSAKAAGADVVVFPEGTVPGYLSMDLLFNRRYIKQNLAGLHALKAESQGITVIVGFVDTVEGKSRPGGRPLLYNSAAVIRDGRIEMVQDKTLLPNYDIFDEKRYFESDRGQALVTVKGTKIGIQLCEDLWKEGYARDPSAELKAAGAELIVNLSASPFHLGKFPVREKLLRETAVRTGVPFVYANLVGCFDGYDGEVIFDGRSMVMMPSGELAGLGKSFSEDLLIVDVHQPKKVELPTIQETAELHDALVLGIRDYFYRLEKIKKLPLKCALIGLSGGIDSALVAALAKEALGPDKVLGVTLPFKYSSKETRDDAKLVADNLGIKFKSFSIQGSYDSTFEELQSDPELSALAENVAEENLQPRDRMKFLMYIANKIGAIVLNTGNRTELALDNMTIYGDMVGGLGVIADVDKDRVYALSRYINEKAGKEIIPRATIDRPPSAELKPNQIDANVMGADPQVIAPLVRSMIEDELSPEDAIEKFSGKFSPALIKRSFRRLDNSEWKRRQAAPGLRVTPHTFGHGRRMPMNHGFWDN